MKAENQKLEVYIDGLNDGGAEHLLLSMIPILVSNFLEVEVLTFHGRFPLEPKFRQFVKVTQHTPIGILLRLWNAKSTCYIGLSKSIFLASLVVLVKRIFRIKVVGYTCHEHASLDYHSARESLIKRIFDAFYKKLIFLSLRKSLFSYVVSTEARMQELRNALGHKVPILVFPNSIPNNAIVELKKLRPRFDARMLSESGKFRLFTLSRLDPVKQLTWAIDAALAIAQRYPGIATHLEICGKGQELKNLQDYAGKIEFQTNLTVSFPGFVSSVMDPIKVSDLYLFPSRTEGFPLSLTEVGISGMPCVATNCSHGVREIAGHFNSIELATPPTHSQFLAVTLRVAGNLLSAGGYNRKSSSELDWPSIEELTSSLVEMLKKST